MKIYFINIFVRVVKRKMNNQEKTAEDILNNDYNLTDQEINNIISKI
jgi:hypothetical protein